MAGAVLLLIAAWFSGSTREICEYAQGAQQNDCPTYNLAFFVIIKVGEILNYYGPLIAAFATIAIAAFTYTVKKSTDKLWSATQRSATIAERALTELERPWIFIELVPELRGNQDDEFEEPYAVFDIANHGRGPAIIEEFYGEVTSAELRPDSPLLRDEFHGIVGPGKEVEKCKIYCPRGFKYELAVNPVDNTQFPIPKPINDGWEVFLRMLIHYLDIGGGAHISAFCWRYDHGVCRWVKFEEEPGDKKYNYLT